jgi:lysophospholipase L1-like esterase
MSWTTVRSVGSAVWGVRGALAGLGLPARVAVCVGLVFATGCGATGRQTQVDSGADTDSNTSANSALSSSAASSSGTNQTVTSDTSGQVGKPLSGPDVFPDGVTKPKIMIVGDSISAGPGCYKGYLERNLRENGITNYEFVGKYEDACGSDVRHSAVSCTTTAQYAALTFKVDEACKQTDQKDITDFPGMAALAEEYKPDLIMLQLGVNDVWNGDVDVAPILANYTTLVEQARRANPKVVVVVAQIQKVITQDCPADKQGPVNPSAEQLVQAVPAWAQTVSTEESKVLTADLWTNSDTALTNDCVHPNTEGAHQMGLNWYNAIKGLLTFP